MCDGRDATGDRRSFGALPPAGNTGTGAASFCSVRTSLAGAVVVVVVVLATSAMGCARTRVEGEPGLDVSRRGAATVAADPVEPSATEPFRVRGVSAFDSWLGQ
jgi:hypothetical protein